MTIHTGTLIENVQSHDDKVTFSYGDQQGEADYLVIAAGRGPDVEALGLDAAGVKLDDRGLIEIDGALRTSAKGVYAIGDLVKGPALAHKASDEGVIAVEDAAGLETHPIEYIDIPRATFCTPMVGSFGLTEEQAREQGIDVVVGKVQYGAVGAGTVYGDRTGVIKIIGDKQLRRAGRRPHRRLQGDRADPGARQRQGARGRLSRGRAHHPRPPDARRGRDGGRARRGRLADPRLSRGPAALLLRLRLARRVPRRRARDARAAGDPGVDPGAAGRAGGGRRRRVPLRRGGADLPRGRRGARPPLRAAGRSAGPSRSRPTRAGRCSPPPTRSRSAAAWRSRWPRSGRRSRAGATSASATTS